MVAKVEKSLKEFVRLTKTKTITKTLKKKLRKTISFYFFLNVVTASVKTAAAAA